MDGTTIGRMASCATKNTQAQLAKIKKEGHKDNATLENQLGGKNSSGTTSAPVDEMKGQIIQTLLI